MPGRVLSLLGLLLMGAPAHGAELQVVHREMIVFPEWLRPYVPKDEEIRCKVELIVGADGAPRSVFADKDDCAPKLLDSIVGHLMRWRWEALPEEAAFAKATLTVRFLLRHGEVRRSEMTHHITRRAVRAPRPTEEVVDSAPESVPDGSVVVSTVLGPGPFPTCSAEATIDVNGRLADLRSGSEDCYVGVRWNGQVPMAARPEGRPGVCRLSLLTWRSHIEEVAVEGCDAHLAQWATEAAATWGFVDLYDAQGPTVWKVTFHLDRSGGS